MKALTVYTQNVFRAIKIKKKDKPEYQWICSGSGEEVLIQPDGKVLARIRQVGCSNIYQAGKDQYYGINQSKRAAEQKLFGWEVKS